MSVTDGQDVSAAITNAAFVSKTANSTVVGAITLSKPTGSGAVVADAQAAINDGITHAAATAAHGATGAVVGTTNTQTLTNKTINGSDNTITNVSLTTGVTGALPIANGGTNNASLAVTAGGVIYTDGTKQVNVGAGITGQFLTSNGASAPTWSTSSITLTPPTIQKFTSGSGTYTTPASCLWIRVRAVGPGGGGSGSSTQAANNGGDGGNGSAATTFGPISAGLGSGGSHGPANGGGGGGGVSLGSAIGTAIEGANGGGSGFTTAATVYPLSGHGGASAFGGSGASAAAGFSGFTAKTNSGSGGSGGGVIGGGVSNFGSGGGSGGYVDAIIISPAASYSYAIGSGGAAGTAGTSGFAGGAGASGYIEVTEYYQ